jgi:hypothetical protein
LLKQIFPKPSIFPKPLPGKKKVKSLKGTLRFNTSQKEIQFLNNNKSVLAIPYDSVKSISYERASKPRYAAGLLLAWPLLFTKSKKHWLTIQFAGDDGSGKFAIIRLDKSNFREALATAEAETGKKVEREGDK